MQNFLLDNVGSCISSAALLITKNFTSDIISLLVSEQSLKKNWHSLLRNIYTSHHLLTNSERDETRRVESATHLLPVMPKYAAQAQKQGRLKPFTGSGEKKKKKRHLRDEIENLIL